MLNLGFGGGTGGDSSVLVSLDVSIASKSELIVGIAKDGAAPSSILSSEVGEAGEGVSSAETKDTKQNRMNQAAILVESKRFWSDIILALNWEELC